MNDSSEKFKCPHGYPAEATSECPDCKNLIESVGKDNALKIYETIKKLGSGEFKNSKLRNENGELMLMWHGSPRKFEEFKTDTAGQFRWRNSGIQFSSSREVVEQYADKAFSAVRAILYSIILKTYDLKHGEPIQEEQLKQAKEIYNKIILDIIENGEESVYYKKGYIMGSDQQKVRAPGYDALTYEGESFGLDWALEIFNGHIPTKDNTTLDEGNGIYLGNGIGKYEYLAVLDIEHPYETDSVNMDHGFELGEREHKQKGTDGTILSHSKGVIGNGGIVVEETKGTYSAAVFDPTKIKILGRREGGKFEIIN